MIGVFDSGFGGLTILKEIRSRLPQYDYLYLGDNARAPYGTRSFEVVLGYTRQAVSYLFAQGCHLVILACNTASAKALRSIQQHDLPLIDPARRVLGVIRPTVEALGAYTRSRHIGILATPGTVSSGSYPVEIAKLWPDIVVVQQPCPMWVPLVENNEHLADGADWFVQKYISRLLAQDPAVDTLLLACTHFPLLAPKIRRFLPTGISLLSQGAVVASSLEDYLLRHPEIERTCTRGGRTLYLTTESESRFAQSAAIFMDEPITARHIEL